MSTVNYTQYGLSPWIDGDFADICATKDIVFTVTLKTDGPKVVLDYNVSNAQKGERFISISKNSVIEVTLDSDQLWFSKEFDAITTKEPLSSYYGNVIYVEDSYDAKLDRYKTVRFKALYNKGGKFGTNHRFNICVDLLQDTEAAAPTWITLTIDPDIRNPPPQ